MSAFDDFGNWFSEHDQHILTSHTAKDRAALKKSIRVLETERNLVREYHDHLEHLLESVQQLKSAIDLPVKGES